MSYKRFENYVKGYGLRNKFFVKGLGPIATLIPNGDVAVKLASVNDDGGYSISKFNPTEGKFAGLDDLIDYMSNYLEEKGFEVRVKSS